MHDPGMGNVGSMKQCIIAGHCPLLKNGMHEKCEYKLYLGMILLQSGFSTYPPRDAPILENCIRDDLRTCSKGRSLDKS